MATILAGIILICTAAILWNARYAVMRHPAADGFFRFCQEDDSDIKIAGAKSSGKTDDTLSEASELDVHRKNGDLEKARVLGALLADRIISQDGESTFGQDSDEDTLMRTQRRLLLAFAALSTVKANIKSRVLQDVVTNVFYDTLKKTLPGFYEDISESASFSFYMLCVRRGGNIEDSVGHTFAMLAAKDGDTVIEELGKALYLHFVDVTLKAIKSFDFK